MTTSVIIYFHYVEKDATKVNGNGSLLFCLTPPFVAIPRKKVSQKGFEQHCGVQVMTEILGEPFLLWFR